MKTQESGVNAENLAHTFLQHQGLRGVERNFRCFAGEIDLIMLDKNELVFIEVRYRSNQDFGGGIESITPNKQHKLIRTAMYYLQKYSQHAQKTCRFDVVAIHNLQAPPLWIKNAFQVE